MDANRDSNTGFQYLIPETNTWYPIPNTEYLIPDTWYPPPAGRPADIRYPVSGVWSINTSVTAVSWGPMIKRRFIDPSGRCFSDPSMFESLHVCCFACVHVNRQPSDVILERHRSGKDNRTAIYLISFWLWASGFGWLIGNSWDLYLVKNASTEVPFQAIEPPLRFRRRSIGVPFVFHSCSIHLSSAFHRRSIRIPSADDIWVPTLAAARQPFLRKSPAGRPADIRYPVSGIRCWYQMSDIGVRYSLSGIPSNGTQKERRCQKIQLFFTKKWSNELPPKHGYWPVGPVGPHGDPTPGKKCRSSVCKLNGKTGTQLIHTWFVFSIGVLFLALRIWQLCVGKPRHTGTQGS